MKRPELRRRPLFCFARWREPSDGTSPYEFEFEARGKDNRVLPKTNYEVVTPDYFKTVGTPLLEGRDFNDHDSDDGEPVAIISQSAGRPHSRGRSCSARPSAASRIGSARVGAR